MSPTIVDLTVSTPAVTGVTEEPREEEVLKSAIQLAQPERLRATLREICKSSPEAFRIARDLLLVPEEQVKHKTIDRRNRVDEDDEDEDEEDSSESSDNEDDSNISDDANGEEKAEDEGDDNKEHRPRVVSVAVVQTNGVKRLRSKFATCLNCSDEFDVTNNGKYSCVWHPGEREPDYDGDTWADHDEDCHGRISDLEDEYPEGFIYNCCERAGDAEGCRIGTHVEKKTAYKRARY